jgi:2-dehydropantoate 2-reductase
MRAVVHPEIQVALWEKMQIVCASSLTAVTRLPFAALFRFAETSELYRGLMREVHAVGWARGVAIPADSVDRQFALMSGMENWRHASQYYDVLAGRQLELESLNGAIVRLGNNLGIQTPFNDAIYATLKPYVGGRPHVPEPPPSSAPNGPAQPSQSDQSSQPIGQASGPI